MISNFLPNVQNRVGPVIRYLLYVSYDGTNYSGSQRQLYKYQYELVKSVMGTIRSGLISLNPDALINVKSSSRTDAGVHALNCAITCDINHPNPDKIFTPQLLQHRLNQIFVKCGELLRINSAQILPFTFDVRRHLSIKTYLYRMAVPKNKQNINGPNLRDSNVNLEFSDTLGDVNSNISQKFIKKNKEIYTFENTHLPLPLWTRDLIFLYPYSDLNFDAMHFGLKLLKGTHDFSSFMSPVGKNSHICYYDQDFETGKRNYRNGYGQKIVPIDDNIQDNQDAENFDDSTESNASKENGLKYDRYVLTTRTLKEAKLSLIQSKPSTQSIHGAFYNSYFDLSRLDYYQFTFQSRGFLYHQVRKMVGSLLALGQGVLTLDDLKRMLDNPDRHKSWNPKILTAPAHGLYLADIEFDPLEMAFHLDQPMINYDPNGNIIKSM